LHLLHHTQQKRFTFTGGLALFAGFLFPCHSGLFPCVRRFNFTAQHVTLHPQQITLLSHCKNVLYFCGRARVLRVLGV